MFRVFHRERAGRPLRALWTLEELGAPYEVVMITREEGRGEEHLRRHPLGRVPVLQDDEGTLFESAAICLHLADLHPEAGLLAAPATRERALVYQWATFAPAEIEPALLEARPQAERDPEHATAARARFDRAVGAVETALDGSEHLVGGRFSIADVMVGTALMFTSRVGLADQLPAALTEYTGRLAQRPAFQAAFKRTFG